MAAPFAVDRGVFFVPQNVANTGKVQSITKAQSSENAGADINALRSGNRRH